jgi:mannose-6-phosphate isomerase-like protein (cupin superfamily)
MSSTTEFASDPALEERHRAAEAQSISFSYSKPSEVNAVKGWVRLGKAGNIRSVVQVVKKNGGENNLHYHTTIDSFWMVLKGRVRFYGPDDAPIGEFGPNEGTFTPAYSRYWFENIGEEDLELLQVSAFEPGARNSGRTDSAPQRFKVGTGEKFDARKG